MSSELSEAKPSARLVRVGIVEAQRLCRELLVSALVRQSDLEVRWHVDDEQEACARVTSDPPDVVLLDALMRGGRVLAVLRELLLRNSATRVMVMSPWRDEGLEAQVRAAGASSFLSSDGSMGSLLDEVRRIGRGSDAAGGDDPPAERPTRLDDPLDPLSPRERQVFRLMVRDLSNDQLADCLGITRRTVETHRARVMRKLGMRSFRSLLHFAMRIGEPIA